MDSVPWPGVAVADVSVSVRVLASVPALPGLAVPPVPPGWARAVGPALELAHGAQHGRTPYEKLAADVRGLLTPTHSPWRCS